MTANRIYDVIVVGAGNAALCAAISAKENGASVLVLEKAPIDERGGNSLFTAGGFRFAQRGLADVRKNILTDLSETEADQIILPPFSAETYTDDLSGEVQDITDRSIPGLFAADELVGGIFHGNYLGGAGLMSGAVFGRLSGQSAAQYATFGPSNRA